MAASSESSVDGLLKFLLFVNIVFIAFGGSMIFYGVHLYSKAESVAVDLDDASSDGTIPLISGILDSAVGLCGVIGVLNKKRIFFMMYIGLLGSVLLTNLLMLIIFPFAALGDIEDAKAGFDKTIRSHYGTRLTKAGMDYTAKIDNHQRKEQCCNFAGINGDNLFLDSPWYVYKHLNISERNITKEKTVPASCCLKIADECESAKDLKAARDNGFLYPKDCLDEMTADAKKTMWVKIIQLTATVMMQVPLVIATLTVMKQVCVD